MILRRPLGLQNIRSAGGGGLSGGPVQALAVTPQIAAGSGGTASAVGNNLGFILTVTVGTAPMVGGLAQITFLKPFTTPPLIFVSAANMSGASGLYTSAIWGITVTNNGVLLEVSFLALTALLTYEFNVSMVPQQ